MPGTIIRPRSSGKPIKVIDTAARLALTGLAKGAIVTEDGTPVIAAITFKPMVELVYYTGFAFKVHALWENLFIATSGIPTSSLAIVAPGTPATEVAHIYYDLWAKHPIIPLYYDAVLSGSTITFTAIYGGNSDYQIGVAGSSVMTFAITAATPAGYTYKLINPGHISTPSAWEVVLPMGEQWIKPKEAFLNTMIRSASVGMGSTLGKGFLWGVGVGATSVIFETPPWGDRVSGFFNTSAGRPTIYFGDNALIQESVDDLVSWLGEALTVCGGAGFSIEGGTNASPIMDQDHADAFITLQFPNASVLAAAGVTTLSFTCADDHGYTYTYNVSLPSSGSGEQLASFIANWMNTSGPFPGCATVNGAAFSLAMDAAWDNVLPIGITLNQAAPVNMGDIPQGGSSVQSGLRQIYPDAIRQNITNGMLTTFNTPIGAQYFNTV